MKAIDPTTEHDSHGHILSSRPAGTALLPNRGRSQWVGLMRIGIDFNMNVILREIPRILGSDPLVKAELIRRGSGIRGQVVIDPPSMTARFEDEDGKAIPITQTSSRAIGTIATSKAAPAVRNASKEALPAGTFIPGFAASATQRAAELAVDRASALDNAAQVARHLERIGRRELARAVRRQSEETWP